jgi:ABC-type Na+ efflux pump permease subunit
MWNALAIAENDLACYAKNRMAIFWTFLGPALCMWFFGFLTPAGPSLAPVSVVSHDQHSPLAAKLAAALRHHGHVVTLNQQASNALWVEVAAPRVILHAPPTETADERSLRYEIQAELQEPPITVNITGEHQAIGGFQRTVPAYLIMFLTMNLLMSGATFSQERASGRLRRLLTAPISSLSIVAGRLASRLVVAWVQMLLLFLIGVFVLHIHWAKNATGLILVLSLYVLAMGSIGILIGACFHDPDHASAFAMWGALVLAPLTGLWWPIELMPALLQKLAHWLPTGWTMESVNSMLAYGSGLSQFPIAWLGSLTVAAIAIVLSTRRLATLT